jgi:hypothetical protein
MKKYTQKVDMWISGKWDRMSDRELIIQLAKCNKWVIKGYVK